MGNALLSSRWQVLIAFGLVIVATVTVYTLVLIPIAGLASDKWGRLSLAAGTAAVIFVTAAPLLAGVVTAQTFVALLSFQMWIGIQLATYLGALPALMAELFPTRIRATGLGVSYSFAVAVFGGFAPLIKANLIAIFDTYIAPGILSYSGCRRVNDRRCRRPLGHKQIAATDARRRKRPLTHMAGKAFHPIQRLWSGL